MNDRAPKDDDHPADDDATLGAKIAHLRLVAGYMFPLRHTTDKAIAGQLGVPAESWSRMKSGELSINNDRLSRLAAHFRFDGENGLTAEAFLSATLRDFKSLLKQQRYGAYGTSDLDFTRYKLSTAENVCRNGIVIERIPTQKRGFTIVAEPRLIVPVFRRGEFVTVKITHPGGGFLALLSDRPDRQMEWLMPSPLAPYCNVQGTATRLPTPEGRQNVMNVGPPTGHHRLYSLWTRTPLPSSITHGIAIDADETQIASAKALRELGTFIDRQDRAAKPGAKGGATYEIRIAEYDVVD